MLTFTSSFLIVILTVCIFVNVVSCNSWKSHRGFAAQVFYFGRLEQKCLSAIRVHKQQLFFTVCELEVTCLLRTAFQSDTATQSRVCSIYKSILISQSADSRLMIIIVHSENIFPVTDNFGDERKSMKIFALVIFIGSQSGNVTIP